MKKKYILQIIKIIILFSFLGSLILPNYITNLFKPIVIIMTMFIFFKSKKKMNLYLVIIFFSLLITLFLGSINIFIHNLKYMNLISFEINILFFFCLVFMLSNFRNKYLFNKSIKYSSLLLAIVVVMSNPIIGEINSAEIKLLSIYINKNSIPYLISPGLFILINELQELNLNFKSKIYGILQLIILLYAGIYPMSRGGFLSLFLPIMINELYKFKKRKVIYSIKPLVIITLVCFFSYLFLPSQYIERLLNIENYTLEKSSGRNVLFLEALEYVKDNKIIGMGLGYYQKVLGKSYGTHNVFLDIYLAFGMVGVAIFILLFIYPIIKKINSKTISWIVMAMVAAVLESQLSYQIWIPLVMAWGNTYSFSKKRRVLWQKFQ